MVYALSWLIVIVLTALWSFAAWALHGVAVWTVSSAGSLTGVASGAGSIAMPDWLAPWIPPEVGQWASQLMAGAAPLVDSLLQAAPALAGGLNVAAWVIWGIGSVLLVLLGTGMHLLIALTRRHSGSGTGSDSGTNSSSPLAAG